MGLIFLLSDQPKDASMRTSGFFLMVFEWLGLSDLQMEQYHLPFLVRKLAHLSVYFVLGLWSIRLEKYYWPRGPWPWRALLWCMLYAASDEWHQAYVPGRGASPIDVLIDSTGAWLSWGAGYLYQKKYIYRSVDHKM